MDSVVLLAFRIGLLVLLWFFVLMTLRALRADTKTTASLATGGGAVQTASPAKPSIVSALKKSDAPSQLRVIEGPLVGSHMDISSLDEVVMGRSPQCTVVVGDDFAAARHARLFKQGSEWFVEDLDSRNGTFVGGYRIDQPERVNSNSDIKIGRTIVRLEP